jgi:Ca2+-transporting ATPase
MATLPEEFPVVLTIFLALGAWRISQKRVLTRRIPAIETLGAATVLCVDKTGTLTQNRMSIRQLCVQGEVFDTQGPAAGEMPELFHRLVEFGILASKKDPFDPMEKALRDLGGQQLAQTEHLHENWTLVQEYPLSTKLLALSHVWVSPDGSDVMVAAIGDLCHFGPERMAELSRQVVAMAAAGLRVLGVAQGLPVRQADLPGNQHDFTFTFLGLIGLADPIRPAVPQAIEECRSAGIRVVMITGDYPATAQSIARQIGLANVEEVITGPELDRMDEEELRVRLRRTNIMARVVPVQ